MRVGRIGYEFYAEGLRSGMLSPEAVIRDYQQGKISDIDLCRLAQERLITYKDIAAAMGKSPSAVSRMCRKLLEEEQIGEVKDWMEQAMTQMGTRGGLTARRAAGGNTPIHSIIAEVASRTLSDAVQGLDYYISLGKQVHNLAYYYASKDPRYSESLKYEPQATLIRFIEDAFAFYVAFQEFMERIRNIVWRLYNVIERYESLVRRLLPKLYPSIRYEMEARLALTLIDRMILARLLGVKLGKLPKFAFTWMEMIGDKYLKEELLKVLWGVPYEQE